MDENTNSHPLFVQKIQDDLSSGIKHNKVAVEKIAAGFGIYNRNHIKELTELAIVRICRQIAQSPGLSNFDKYQKIVETYNNQVNLSQRTSQSMLLQQYSTPAPISYVASLFVSGPNLEIQTPNSKLFFEPSAGNGLLTIALPYQGTFVNELDDIRIENLRSQPFAKIECRDATIPFTDYYKKFDGVITNPPFGTLMEPTEYDGYKISTLDHLMALRALDTMKDTGRAAIIIGGHTTWDELGRIQAGKNRLFFNYLYSHYNVDDVLLIDGHKLYSRQGTSFDVRLILINGRKQNIDGFAPVKNEVFAEIIADFSRLWNRVFYNQKSAKEILPSGKNMANDGKNIDILKLKIKIKAKALKLMESLAGPFNKSRKQLSAYTIASNCTDKTDIIDAIEEIRDAVKSRKIRCLKIPDYYYVRWNKLEDKLKKLSGISIGDLSGYCQYNDKIKDYFNDKLDDFYINLGKPKKSLIDCGLSSVDIVITKRTISKKVTKHILTIDKFICLPAKINNPLMVFKSLTYSGAFLIFIEDFNHEGLLGVAIHPNKRVDHVINEVNEITTFGGRRFSQIVKYLESDSLLYSIGIKRIKDFLMGSQFNSAQSEKILNLIAKIQKIP